MVVASALNHVVRKHLTAMKPMETKPKGRIPIDRDCLLFILPIGILGALVFIWGATWIWGPALALIVVMALFFRDPPRMGPAIKGALWSPADGKVVAIEPNADPDRGPVPGMKIVIFLSVLDVHINRSPCAGEVEKIRLEPGLCLNALNPESSDRNTSNWIFLNADGRKITVRQITGLIARRIVCRVREGQKLRRGQRIGLIRFGSRTELYMNAKAQIKVHVGQAVRGGETVLAIL